MKVLEFLAGIGPVPFDRPYTLPQEVATLEALIDHTVWCEDEETLIVIWCIAEKSNPTNQLEVEMVNRCRTFAESEDIYHAFADKEHSRASEATIEPYIETWRRRITGETKRVYIGGIGIPTEGEGALISGRRKDRESIASILCTQRRIVRGGSPDRGNKSDHTST